MTWATIQEVDEWIDDFAADDPLGALRDLAKHLTSHRLDACALAEPAAALIHAWDLMTPERRAWCLEAVGDLRFIPDRIAPERRAAIRRREGRA